MKWYEEPKLLSYLIDCYVGTERSESGKEKRQFIWDAENGDLVIGNSKAFTDHLRKKFGLHESKGAWVGIHEVLRALGEVVQIHSQKKEIQGTRFKYPLPEIRILKKKENR